MMCPLLRSLVVTSPRQLEAIGGISVKAVSNDEQSRCLDIVNERVVICGVNGDQPATLFLSFSEGVCRHVLGQLGEHDTDDHEDTELMEALLEVAGMLLAGALAHLRTQGQRTCLTPFTAATKQAGRFHLQRGDVAEVVKLETELGPIVFGVVRRGRTPRSCVT